MELKDSLISTMMSNTDSSQSSEESITKEEMPKRFTPEWREMMDMKIRKAYELADRLEDEFFKTHPTNQQEQNQAKTLLRDTGAYTLWEYLESIDTQAQARLQSEMEYLLLFWNVDEELKARDQMTWVQKMNQARNVAEESVNAELIYC